MAITLRSKTEIEKLRKAGAFVADALLQLHDMAKPGVTTLELDQFIERLLKKVNGRAMSKGVRSPYASRPFPGSICTSINEQVVHGIPSRDAILRDGDILSVDLVARIDGYCGDSALTFAIGNIPDHKKNLMDVTKRSLDIAIGLIRPGIRWSDVARAIQECAESNGYSVVRDFVGHGIGTEMHCEPQLPNFVSRQLLKNDIFLKEGMILAVEPMICAGTYKVKSLKDGWTVVTVDGKCSAHYEHTVAVVDGGCEILTK